MIDSSGIVSHAIGQNVMFFTNPPKNINFSFWLKIIFWKFSFCCFLEKKVFLQFRKLILLIKFFSFKNFERDLAMRKSNKKLNWILCFCAEYFLQLILVAWQSLIAVTSNNKLLFVLTKAVFCSTSLSLASTRWVRSTIKLFHTLSTHTKQCTAVNKSLPHQEIHISPKNLGNAKNWTWAGWMRSANATSVLCRPPNQRQKQFKLRRP